MSSETESLFSVHVMDVSGYGASPGLALRHAWRQIEARVIAGRQGYFWLLPPRRQTAMRKMFQA